MINLVLLTNHGSLFKFDVAEVARRDYEYDGIVLLIPLATAERRLQMVIVWFQLGI
jgi:hypothetical protein